MVDATGKRAGRGAYLCRNPACWQLALKKDRLDYALKTKLTEEEKQTLAGFAGSLSPEYSPQAGP